MSRHGRIVYSAIFSGVISLSVKSYQSVFDLVPFPVTPVAVWQTTQIPSFLFVFLLLPLWLQWHVVLAYIGEIYIYIYIYPQLINGTLLVACSLAAPQLKFERDHYRTLYGYFPFFRVLFFVQRCSGCSGSCEMIFRIHFSSAFKAIILTLMCPGFCSLPHHCIIIG